MAHSKKSPYQEGREAYNSNRELIEAGIPAKCSNPYPEFSDKWCEWNRGFNSCWMN